PLLVEESQRGLTLQGWHPGCAVFTHPSVLAADIYPDQTIVRPTLLDTGTRQGKRRFRREPTPVVSRPPCLVVEPHLQGRAGGVKGAVGEVLGLEDSPLERVHRDALDVPRAALNGSLRRVEFDSEQAEARVRPHGDATSVVGAERVLLP